MLIGVFSDIHDHLEHFQLALNVYKARAISTFIFCGDFCSPLPAGMLGEVGVETHCVFGNGDGDRFMIGKIAADFPTLKLYGEYAELEIDGRRFAVTHYPFYAKALARTGDYQAVFSGHTHEVSVEHIGECLWVNPGDVMGVSGNATCAIYDTHTNTVEIVPLSSSLIETPH